MSPNAHDKRHLEQNSYFKDKSHPQAVTFPTVPQTANPIHWGQVRWLPVTAASLGGLQDGQQTSIMTATRFQTIMEDARRVSA